MVCVTLKRWYGYTAPETIIIQVYQHHSTLDSATLERLAVVDNWNKLSLLADFLKGGSTNFTHQIQVVGHWVNK